MQRGHIIAGRFEIEAFAGSGGMADVYRALDRSNDTRVALKVLKTNAPDDLARLAREAQALTRLAHPGIVHYVAHGTAEESEAFVVMEWVEGDTLSKRLRAGPMSLADTLRLGRALASALGHAHEHGIVHRDVKPGNIVLRGGDVTDPILLDFGVARTGLAVGLTQLGTVIGTPRYMAPEQARGGQSVDARADVFALGAVMFKCFTGRTPFDGDDALAVLAHLLFDDAPDVCTLAPSVPRSVGDLLLTMLAKEPADRYADGVAVVRAIDALDTTDLQLTVPMPAPSGLTLRERRLLSLMILTGTVDPEVTKKVADGFGGRAEPLADGSVVVFVSGRDNATDLARVSARCALELRRALPEAPIVLATGRGDDIATEADDDGATLANDSTGATASSTSRYSGVFERAAGLLKTDQSRRAAGHALPIMIDDTTAGLLGSDFDIARSAGSVHALHGSTAARAQYTLLGKPTPFVGRTRELASLLATWDDACAQGVSRAMLVVGEAGLGKSRLLYEMLHGLAARPIPTLTLRAKADATAAGSPFAALGPAIWRALSIDDDDTALMRWNKIATRVGSVVAEGESQVADFVAEIAGARLPDPSDYVVAARKDPRLMGDRLRRAWRAWMQGEAARGPVLVILEDLQWGDLPTVKLFDEMFQDLPEEPIFVVAFARPDIDAAFPNIWSRVVERMPLSPLSRKAATAFVSALLDDRTKVDRIVTLASGNALHLEELVRAAAEGKPEVPESLLAVLSAHVELLPDAERRALRAASVFGSTFSVEGVSVLLDGSLDPNDRVRAEVKTLLESLGRREMVTQGGRDLEFRNALVRDVTYQMLTDEDRRRGHAFAADWLERAERADPFVLAEHRERAGQRERAAALFERAAIVALDASDMATALERVKRGKACGVVGQQLAQLCALAADALRWQGKTPECTEEARLALEHATLGSLAHVKALGVIAYTSSFSGSAAALETAVDGLLAVVPSDEALIEWARGARNASNGLTMMGCVAKNDALVSRLEELAARPTADPGVAEVLLVCQGLRAYGHGDFTTLADVNGKSVAQRRAVGDIRGEAVSLANQGFALTCLGRLEEASACYAASRTLAAPLKLINIELNAVQNGAYIRLCSNDAEAAMKGSREILERATEAPRLVSLARLCLSRALARCGQLAEAEREARVAIAAAPNDAVRMYAHAVVADVLVATRRFEEARVLSSEAVTILDKLGVLLVGDLLALIVQAEALEGTGDHEGARRAVTRARRMFDKRRAFLSEDARAVFDAHSPDARRLFEVETRLAG